MRHGTWPRLGRGLCASGACAVCAGGVGRGRAGKPETEPRFKVVKCKGPRGFFHEAVAISYEHKGLIKDGWPFIVGE